MRVLLTAVLLVSLTGCGTIQHADQQSGESYRTEVRQRNLTARAKQSSSDAVRLAAVQGASTVTVQSTTGNTKATCPDLDEQEKEFKELCEEHTEGSGDLDDDVEAVCGPLRAALDKLRDRCSEGDSGGEREVVFAPQDHSGAGIILNLTGASTGDIRFIIQSPGAADQSTNGVQRELSPAPPESIITGMSSGVLDLLSKVTPWAIGGYALGEFADAFGDGMHNAGDRDNSVDNSVDNSIGGNKVTLPESTIPVELPLEGD